MRETLLYIGSHAIDQFIAANPINWHDRGLACRGGIGDQAGMPPTPMVHEFLVLLKSKQALFTQVEYRDHCFQQWHEWPSLKNAAYRKGLEAKLYRNVYPAMIDSLHVWALLVEAHWFDACVLDSLTDAISKHDLIVSRAGKALIAIDIFAGSPAAIRDRQYKQRFRQTSSGFTCLSYAVALPTETRPKKMPGNKRWYCLKDFEQIYVEYCNDNSLWDTAIVPCTCGHHVKTKRYVKPYTSISNGLASAEKVLCYNPRVEK